MNSMRISRMFRKIHSSFPEHFERRLHGTLFYVISYTKQVRHDLFFFLVLREAKKLSDFCEMSFIYLHFLCTKFSAIESWMRSDDVVMRRYVLLPANFCYLYTHYSKCFSCFSVVFPRAYLIFKEARKTIFSVVFKHTGAKILKKKKQMC